MSFVLGPPEPAESVGTEYALWQFGTSQVRIHFDVIEKIRREFSAQSGQGLHGSLYGHRGEGIPAVLWIERFDSDASLSSSSEIPREPLGVVSAASECLFEDVDLPFAMQVLPDAGGAPIAHCYLRDGEGLLSPVLPPFPLEARPAPVPHRRLVPDFDRAAVPRAMRSFEASTETSVSGRLFGRNWWPFAAALALVGGSIGLFVYLQQPQSSGGSPPVRPLGLYVDPTTAAWRVTWNHDSAAIPGKAQARGGLRLFVQDGGEQNLIELSPGDLAAGKFEYQPQTRDVTFRLEATGTDGRVTAESFRILKPAAEPPPPAPTAETPVTPAKPTHRAPPVVDARMRPRIRGKIRIDIRAEIDRKGRVTAAKPVKSAHSRLETYLTGRAVRAASEWRFDPARKEGIAVSSAQTIHFVFER